MLGKSCALARLRVGGRQPRRSVARKIFQSSARPHIAAPNPTSGPAVAVWLCSSAASYVMGHIIVVDGGMTIGGFEFK
jgi:NAD(P)-dependent dehydrogenase (short-subunit alcohol dehydrogenase family)